MRFLNTACVTAVALTLIFQAVLLIPGFRDAFIWQDEMEGAPLEREAYLFNKAKIQIKLSGDVRDENVKVLLNGDEVADFWENRVLLDIIDGDVIEIDGTASSSAYTGTVGVIPGEHTVKSVDRFFTVNKNVIKLGKAVIQPKVK
jgi:hypothetical protein